MNIQTKIKRLPRYTSYPTALEFKELSAHKYVNWLTSLNSNEPVSLYIHIPYCSKLCWFCGCFMKVANKYDAVAKYVDALIQEIGLVAQNCGAKDVSHVHFGGGSPTILTPEDFEKIMNVIRANFVVKDDAEIAVEIDPRTLSEEKVKAYARSGVNRVSIGIQDFDTKIQKAINRIQSEEIITDSIAWLNNHGIKRINFDLIYGLPHQTLCSIKDTISQAARYKPDRISLFGYAHVPWVKKHMQMICIDDLPGAKSRLVMFKLASAILLSEGYKAIGLDHFALPNDELSNAKNKGTLKRNFQGYTTDNATSLIGLGISSIGSFIEGFAKNTSSFSNYYAKISAGELPIEHGLEVSASDLMRREIISDLMCFSKFNPHSVAMRYGLSENFSREELALSKLIAEGILKKNKDTYSLTKKGSHYRRAIATIFDEYFPQNIDIVDRCILESAG